MAAFGLCCFFIVWTVFFTTFFAKAQISLPCDPGWLKTPSGATCVKLFDNPTKSWKDARRACNSTGGDLVTIRDKDMSNFIKVQFVNNNTNPIWIGLHKLGKGDGWRWLDEDVTPTYTDWRGNPKQSLWYKSKNCGFLKQFNKGEAAWNNWICGYKHQYICEKPIASPCYPEWVKTPRFESCIKIGITDWQFPWWAARRLCQKFGGDLVTIRDNTMSNFISDRIVAQNNFSYWIGLHKSTGKDIWHWNDEEGTTHTIPHVPTSSGQLWFFHLQTLKTSSYLRTTVVLPSPNVKNIIISQDNCGSSISKP
ncbi:mannose receptor c type 1 [Plakobranchus ocellatus]|uniref:Mannose receptor c type 1 n=1 Tax=Plakobranchus ocellatus TaxID=259542 RepID=A0AAV3ZUB1_9GAST|nr:mannose receptor c type 1 [Plakobranchus ocellatus]